MESAEESGSMKSDELIERLEEIQRERGVMEVFLVNRYGPRKVGAVHVGIRDDSIKGYTPQVAVVKIEEEL